VPRSESAARPEPAASAPAASAGTRGPADRSPADPAPAGLSPVDTLRQNWAAVLEAVKRERRVASMLLADATVLSLEDGTLTLQFARAGNLKGFTTGSYDADLKRVLSSGFGLNVMVKGVVGGNSDPGGPGPGPAGPGPAGSGRGLQVAAEPPPPSARPAAAGYYDEPPDEMPPDEDDDVPPDEPSSPRASPPTELTGMDLIQRELGGQVIGEIEG
jgi:DNA polymerase-3 subunit gamma/tau